MKNNIPEQDFDILESSMQTLVPLWTSHLYFPASESRTVVCIQLCKGEVGLLIDKVEPPP